jgi:uncharacterized protein (DUF983 family)
MSKENSENQAGLPPIGPASGTWSAMLQQLCPRCHIGQIFRTGMTMNDPCPHCGLVFQREEGYFLGAMYASYLIGLVILIPIYFVLSAFLPTWNSFLVAVLALIPYVPLTPFVFRYSRVLWIYFDRLNYSQENLVDGYEQNRKQQLTAAPPAPPGKPPADI